ncbi:lipid droplet defective isoform X2 [Lasioglossum baleicum]|uniref:lipid droplet defective isoform X2 n=1 Tax=Lasioglossum baleicum TaxID=434251 RepID=UPI003FCCE34C
MRVDQIGLLLWKNYIVRKRQPGILALVFVWPVIVFMILYTIRDNVDPEYYPTCQFPARAMPRNGLLPFVQSFICSLGNPCDPLSEYEEVPSYKNATLGALITEIQPMLSNETVLSAVKTLPHSIQLLKSMAQILTKPEIKALFDRGIRLGDLFNNHEEIKRVLRAQMPDARRGLVDDLFDSSIKLVYLVEAFGSTNVGDVICSPESLKKYLILPTEKDYVQVSKILCDIDSETIPSILENLSKHLDFSGMLKMVDRVMAKFRDYDIFVDLRRAVETILDLDTSKKLIPEYLRIRQWLPKIIMMFKNVTFKEIDLTLVNKTLEILDPVFESEEDWPIARQAFLRLQNILALLKEMGVDQHSGFTGNFFTMIERFVSSMQFLPSVPAKSIEKLARIADAGFAILQSGAQLSSKILDRHKDDLQLPPEVWKGLKEFFSDRIIATLSYAFAFTQSVVRTVHHAAIIHEDLENRLYHVSLANKDVVQQLLTNVDPSAYRTAVRSFSRLDFVEKFVEAVTDAKPEDYFCRKDTLNEVFDDFEDSGQGAIASEILCSDKGKKFLSEVYGTMELQKFEGTARDTLDAAMSMIFKQAIFIEKANLTGVVSSVNDFMSFMDKPRKSHTNWSVFTVDETWTKVFEDTKPRNRLNVLGLHLSIAKMIGCCNLSFQVIKSDMKSIDFIARMTLQDLTENKDDWVGEVTRRKYELLETFYLTATDRTKVLQILEYDNFTRSYCVDPSPPPLITFPRDTNSTLLKTLICRLASIVQNDLDSDIEMIRVSTAGTRFNWTAFNEITIGIYRYIDVFIHEKTPSHQLMNLEKLKKHFRASWSTDLSVRDGFEISVGLICKFFKLLESPLFNIQSKSGWKIMDSLGWLFTLIMDMLQNAFLEVSRADSGRVNYTHDTLELPETRDLISVTLFNLRDLILDVIDIVTMKPIHFISLLDDYKTREDRWPCVQKESVGAALEFRSGSRAWIEKIENISCSPGEITREWRAYPTAYYLVHGSGETPPLKFNWTEGYRALRNLTEQFENWVIVTEKSLSDSLGSSSAEPDVLGGLSTLKTIFDERWQNSEDDTNTVLNLIDMELDKTMPAFHSELRASDVWKEDVFIDDRVLITAKFASDVVHKVTTLVSSILRTDTGEYNIISDYSDSTTSSSESEFTKVVEMKWLPLLGFTNKSPIGILYNKLPYLLATLADGLTDLDLDKLITKSMSNEIDLSCDQLFDHWPTSSKVFTLDDHETLKKFVCYLTSFNFNVYTDLFMAEAEIWRTPANQYRSRLMSVISDAYDLSNILRNITKMRVMIEVPFSGHYFKWLLSEMLSTFEKSEKYYQNTTTVQVPTDLTDYRLIIEGVSECLLHIANTVNKINDIDKLQKNRMNIWDFVQGTEVRRLLKILDAHPEETIALVAQMLEIGSRTGNFSYENIRKTICNWSPPNRSLFIQQVCSFDPYQLLRSVTSEQYYMALTVRRSSLTKLTPLNTSLGKLAEAMLSLLSNVPHLKLQSNIFDQKTWTSLSNDTVSKIRSVGRSWVHWYATEAKNSKPGQSKLDRFFQTEDTFVKITRVYQLLDASVDLMIGGDVWQKLRYLYEGSKVKPVLTLIEDTPNIVVSIVDTFLKSDRLDQFLEKLAKGKAHPCDLDKYLIVPGFVRKKVLLSSIANFCEKLVFSEKQLTWLDVLPLDAKYEEARVSGTGEKELNETFLLERVDRMQSTIIRIISEGPREPKVPSWWTSFKEGAFNDFVAHYKKEDPRALAHLTVKKLTKIALDILNFDTDSKDCSWCFSMFLIDVLNSQLENHGLYAELPCKMSQMNISEIQSVVLRDFHWNETTHKIKNFRTLYAGRTPTEWMASMEKMLLHIVDMVVDFQNETYSDTIGKCFRKFFGDPPMSRPGLYVSVLLAMLENLQQNVYILDTSRYHKSIDEMSKKSAKFVPIWKDLKEVTIPKYVEDVESFLPGATINVNAILNDRDGSLCRTKAECRNATVLQEHLGSKKAGKLFRYDPKVAAYPASSEIAERLSWTLDLDLISREVKVWRMDASLELTWLKEILRHLAAVIAEGRDLLDVASKIDFEDISNVLGVPDVIDGVLNILREKTVDKLFDGMREVIEDAKPFIEDPGMLDDIYKMISTLESMDIFKNLGLLNMKYVIKDMFDNWGVVSSYLNDKINVTNTVLSMLSEAKVDMISVFMKERKALSMKEIICSPKKLNEMLIFNGRITAEEVSAAVCQLEDAQTQNVTIALIKNMNFDYIFTTLMSANVKNILANANLTETEGRMVLNNLGVAAELIPFFKEKFASSMPKAESLKANVEREEDDQPMSTGKFLEASSKMLCGQAMVSDNGDLYKIISKIEDNSKQQDQAELDSLPTDFCRDTYKSFITMGGGKIIWSYVKPLLRGQILYAPNTTVINKVMALSNKTFVEMENFGVLMDSFVRTLSSLANLSDMSDNLKDLQDMMSSDVMKIAIKSLGGGSGVTGDLSSMDFGEISWQLKKNKRMVKMIGMLNDLLGCVLVDRVRGFRNEDEMEAEARMLMDTREFLAGVVFMDEDPVRSRRSLSEQLPENVVYKIRMDIDYVQSTKRLKNQFWIPGPESSFIEHLRYVRGFVQLQDSIDRAIIWEKSGKDLEWQTVTQQMPYPCWKQVPFQTTLYESQGIQVCFFFALMMCVGSAVRHIVWERESQNAMVMSVMGLKPWRNTVAWFITTYTEVMIVMVSIAMILLVGKILPKSDPLLILVMMIDYAFSIVTFCYMISTMCSSASLSAITTVVMFLLTYMPYIIVIAMEAVLGLGYKLLICLSMSTSFCYGCLYAARKEVQGVGLTWSAMWEESAPGDSMSLGLSLLMIAFDGCLYAIIGYLVTRYTNTDEETDSSSLVVNEKQTGVRFEGVRKVYNSDEGEVVAVDNFTLKMCEGEVTSLLGRNGAGKTTIIKMLTGMLAPTTGEICLNGEEDCKPDIGVCPQDNVLIGTLTPREHMVFYAKLKRPKESVNMQRSVDEMLTSLELGKQEHEPVYRLSGGTKRRLCVALAFLGSPKLVILDEPGAGVDPAARRRIWRLIDQHRIGRTVILSTHHLDEADMLSDTVVVMHKGKILCTGSPLSLKMMHGRGYRLLVSFPGEKDGNTDVVEKKRLEDLKNVIEEVIPNAETSEIAGNEVVVTLPFQGKNGVHNNIGHAAKVLEDSRKVVGYSHFSLECDTLERVFLDLCARAENGSTVIGASQDSVATVDYVGLSMPTDDIDLIDDEPTLSPSPVRQARALLKKRMWHFRKDWMTLFAGLFLPTIFVAVAMGFSLIRPPSQDEPALPLTPKLYDTHPTYFYSVDNNYDSFLQHVSLQLHDRFGDDYAGAWQTLPNDTGTCNCVDSQQVCHGVSQPVEGLLQVLPGRPTLDWIVSTHHAYIERRYGGWSLSHLKEDPLFIVWFNNKGHHALPSYLSALNEAILRASGVQGHLTTLNHPLRLSSDQLNRTTLLQHVADVGVALVLLIAFSLVAAQGSKELVRERLSEEKRILFLAGVHPITYWTTALIWDFFVFGLSILLAVIVFEIFGLPAYVARHNLAGICLLLCLFAWAALPFSHLMEKIFNDSSLSNMVLFCTNTFIGVFSLATILVLDILGRTKTTEDARNTLHQILLIFPQYALGDALVQISRNDITASLLEKFNMDTYQSPLGWDLLGLHFVFLAIVGTILFSLNLMIECRVLPTWNRRASPHTIVEEDDDVSKERMRVESGMSEDILQAVKLRKEYTSVYGTNVAVQNLSIGVQAGKCFGLLGTNGAGKSSTFRMLTTEIIPTSGRIILKGQEVGKGPLCNGEIGYCPQSDGLDGFLSPHQCLTIHGEVCGLSNVPKAVELTLKRLDLLKYAHKRVSSLSGGNKRKLCTALSVMAPVSVVLMDEPTSGMDPATKDLVAKTIRRMTKSQSCVILTSHSVAECENLCNRVGILAKAGLRCIGTPQHLKHKFGEGYVAFLRFRQPVSAAELKKVLAKYLPQAVVSSRQGTAARLLLPRSQDMLLSVSFNKVKLLAEELKASDFTLSQSSLDQVLVNFSEEMDTETDGSIYSQDSVNNMLNSYSTADTIRMDTF